MLVGGIGLKPQKGEKGNVFGARMAKTARGAMRNQITGGDKGGDPHDFFKKSRTAGKGLLWGGGVQLVDWEAAEHAGEYISEPTSKTSLTKKAGLRVSAGLISERQLAD